MIWWTGHVILHRGLESAGSDVSIPAAARSCPACSERDFFIDNLLVRTLFIIAMIWWTGLALWEFDLQEQTRSLHAPPGAPLLPHPEPRGVPLASERT